MQDAPRDVITNHGTDAGRLIVIAFDWSIRFYDQALARRIALAAVDRLGPADEATVVFTRPGAASGKPQGFTADHARLRAAINQPFAVALTHPDRNSQIIDPGGYNSGECLCGVCTLETLTQPGQTLRAVPERPKVVLFIGTYVRAVDEMRPTQVPIVPPGPNQAVVFDHARDDRLLATPRRRAADVRTVDGRGQRDRARSGSRRFGIGE
jgi:hypothetical protein